MALFKLPVYDSSYGNYYSVYWGDGTETIINSNSSVLVHDYATTGTFSLSILPRGGSTSFNNVLFVNSDEYATHLRKIKKWGSFAPFNFDYSYYGATNLGYIEKNDVLNMANATSLNYTWYGCISLTSFPNISTGKVTNFNSTWYGCSSLSATNFPTLDMGNMTDGTNCFLGVKLPTISYSSLLSSININNNNIGVVFHGGDSQYDQFGKIARDELTRRGIMPMDTKNPFFHSLRDGRFFFCGSPYNNGDVSLSTNTYLGTLSGKYINWVRSNDLPVAIRTNHVRLTQQAIGQLSDNRIAMYDGQNTFLGTLSTGNSISWNRNNSFNYLTSYDATGFNSYTLCLMEDLSAFFLNGGRNGGDVGILKTFIGKIGATNVTWISATNPTGTSSGDYGMSMHFSVASGNKIIIGGGESYADSAINTSKVDIGTVNVTTGNITWASSTDMPVSGPVRMLTFSNSYLIIPNYYIGTVNFTDNTITWNPLSSINNNALLGPICDIYSSTASRISSIYCGYGNVSAAHILEFDTVNKTQKTNVFGYPEWTIIDGGLVEPLVFTINTSLTS